MRTPFFIVLGFLWLPVVVQAQTLTGFNVLRLESSARAAALGGSLSAVYDGDINAFFYNPSLLQEGMHNHLTVSYLNHLSDVSAGTVAYSRHLPSIGSVAAGLRFLYWGSLERTDQDGTQMGNFAASDVVLTLGAARSYKESLRYGVNMHMVYSSVDSYAASALAVDLGVLYWFSDQRVGISASVSNLGVTLSSLGMMRDTLPVDLRISLTKKLRYVPLLLSVTGYSLQTVFDEPSGGVFQHLLFGGEFAFSRVFHLRLGYNHRRHQALKKTDSRLDLAGVGMGFGIHIRRFQVDYAFHSWSFSGLHQLTIRTKM